MPLSHRALSILILCFIDKSLPSQTEVALTIVVKDTSFQNIPADESMKALLLMQFSVNHRKRFKNKRPIAPNCWRDNEGDVILARNVVLQAS